MRAHLITAIEHQKERTWARLYEGEIPVTVARVTVEWLECHQKYLAWEDEREYPSIALQSPRQFPVGFKSFMTPRT